MAKRKVSGVRECAVPQTLFLPPVPSVPVISASSTGGTRGRFDVYQIETGVYAGPRSLGGVLPRLLDLLLGASSCGSRRSARPSPNLYSCSPRWRVCAKIGECYLCQPGASQRMYQRRPPTMVDPDWSFYVSVLLCIGIICRTTWSFRRPVRWPGLPESR